MARLTNSLLVEGKIATPNLSSSKIGLKETGTVNMLDLTYGGQHGYAPNLVEWVNNQAYTRRNLIPILLEAPKFFKQMGEPERWHRTLRSLVELHCRTIEGLNSTITVETADHPVGGAGEVQEEFVNVTRERSQPKFTFVEKYGRPIQMFLHHWITYGMMDPESKFALLATLGGSAEMDMLADMYTMSMIFIEPDPMHRKVDKAWLCTNMFPKSTGEITGRRDLTSSSEILTLDIEFTALTQVGLGVNIFAQKILDKLNIQNANPYLRKAFMDGVYSGSEFGGSPDTETETADGSNGDLAGIRSNNYNNSIDKVQSQV